MINLATKAVENSKNTAGEGGNNPSGGNGQLTVAQITQLVGIASTMGCNTFQNHVFMDTDIQMRAHYTGYAANYNLRTLEQEAVAWGDAVHDAGMVNVWRGTFSGIKANNNFPFLGYNQSGWIPRGTVASAPTDGETTWCGKVWRFMNVNVGPTHWENGDWMMPVSECTEFFSHIPDFSHPDQKDPAWLWFTNSNASITQVVLDMVSWFNLMKQVVDAYGASIGKSIKFATIVNNSEWRSGTVGQSLANGHITSDYYGHPNSGNGTFVMPANYVAEWIATRNAVGGGLPLYQTEMGGIFGDSWPSLSANGSAGNMRITTYEDACLYMIKFFKAYRDSLVDPGLMDGVSNWGFWSGQNSSVVGFTAGNYYLNYCGQIYANFIKGNGMTRIPVASSDTPIMTGFGNRSVHF